MQGCPLRSAPAPPPSQPQARSQRQHQRQPRRQLLRASPHSRRLQLQPRTRAAARAGQQQQLPPQLARLGRAPPAMVAAATRPQAWRRQSQQQTAAGRIGRGSSAAQTAAAGRGAVAFRCRQAWALRGAAVMASSHPAREIGSGSGARLLPHREDLRQVCVPCAAAAAAVLAGCCAHVT